MENDRLTIAKFKKINKTEKLFSSQMAEISCIKSAF